MTGLTQNDYANRAYAKAGMLVNKIGKYLESPTEASDLNGPYSELIDSASRLSDALHSPIGLCVQGAQATPRSELIDLLIEVEQFAVEVITKIDYRGFEADRIDLGQDISGARRSTAL
ncbi:hypothetical protein [Clavibacter phaseoli]|uniref:hypothetical protein n=1 Tax=Clavibacter phaseoli TaxID=1734031 RepID=UPI001F419C83|nr:hypothetical protein [Clavibacter phaseoli]UKF32453.1 hypothetical protein FGD69_15045 [Clavibacter phaseoli]UKF38526.1 hypothetical protein FGI33_15305 [Clavibacter phaseoli]